MADINGHYDYYTAVKEDVLRYIEDNVDLSAYDTRDELEEYLNDVLWTEDSVTGNGSGSYTHFTLTAAEDLTFNFDLLAEAMSDFGCGWDDLAQGPEACDVTIRCYLLNHTISEVLDELEDEFNSAHEVNEEQEM